MDRSKNRTDMLAAGRKKLQQYRQKKGGGSPAKSSSSFAKPGNENGSEGPSNLSQATPAAAADLASVNQSDASVSGTVQKAEGLWLVPERLPSGLDIQDIQSGALLNFTSLALGSDLVATSLSSSDGDSSASYVNSQTDLVKRQNGGAQRTSTGNPVGETFLAHQTHTRVEDANGPFFVADRSEEAGLNPSFSKEMDKNTYQEQNFEGLVSSETAAITHEGIPVVLVIESERILLDTEEAEYQEMKPITDPEISLDSAEEPGTSLNVSDGFKEQTLLEPIFSLNEEALHIEQEERVSEGGNQPEDEVSSLQTCRMTDSSISGLFEPDGMLMAEKSACKLESIKEHLYGAYIAKDILQLYLVEQNQLNEDLDCHSSHETHTLFKLVNEAQASKEIVTKELVQCSSELKILSIARDELENKCLLERREIEHEKIKYCNLENELHKSQEDMLHLSKELAICQGSLDALQKENSTLIASLILETDARKKLGEEVEALSSENMIHLAELKAKDQTQQTILERNVKLQDSLRELSSCFEQLIEENIYLSCNFDVYKVKFNEIRSWLFESTCHGQEGQISDVNLTKSTTDMPQMFYDEPSVDTSSDIKLKSNSFCQEVSLLQRADGKNSDRYTSLKVLKEQIQLAKCNLEDLEKTLKGMHCHSLSFNGSSGLATKAGVSKLIKAFESKSNHLSTDINGVPLTISERPEDSYNLLIEQISSLSNTLNTMELELGKVVIFVMDNQHDLEGLKKFKMDCEYQKHQNNCLQAVLDGFSEKFVIYEHKLYGMLNNITELDQDVNAKADRFLNEIDLLGRKASEDFVVLEQERDIIVGMISEAVGKLGAATRVKVLEDLDSRSHFVASVDAAILAIDKLHCELEESNRSYRTLHDSHEQLNKSLIDMQVKHNLGGELFLKFYSKLVELISIAQRDTGDTLMSANLDEVLEPPPEKCELVVNCLTKLLSERAYLFSRSNKLNSDLSIRNQEIEVLNTQLKGIELQKNIRGELESTLLDKTKEIEEVKRRCFLLVNELKNHRSCERDALVSKDANDFDSCNSLLLQLEELVSFHLCNYEKIVDEIKTSRKLLQDANLLMEVTADDFLLPLPAFLSDVLIPSVIALHENLKSLTASNVGKETEILTLKEGMSKMEETLKACYYELELKTSEVEQSEQKLSSVREKLSIAVAKGKGLIVQRDNLKQVLMEKTSELELSTQELLLKESKLYELEKKLKSCSEVERIESLESELLYIRNSASALRDSFLQKDSVLQRIEEVLEVLDLPDDFHDKDIIEKIELLSRFVTGHPSTVIDLDQKCLEYAHSDARVSTVIDADRNSFLLAFDELKRKHEELQGKFYGLAEHNDMLEQSFLERNNLVQKWEESLGSLDLPSHMRTKEPDDRIKWLGKELSVVKEERDSLQLKINNLEISSNMLIVDVEEAHKKISELIAEVVVERSEKEALSKNLEKLRFEYFTISEKAVYDEQDRDNLLKELGELQEYCKAMENNLRNLHDLVCSTLTESDKIDFLFGGTLVEILEESLKKLINNYSAMLKKSSIDVSGDDALPNENSPYHGNMVPEGVLLEKESELASMRLELNHTFNKLASVEEDKNAIFLKWESLRLEIEDLKTQIHVLNVEKNETLEKHQSVLLELDAKHKHADYLQEQLTQEEQKSASFKEKLNLAVRKGKGLVQQRDNLKQTVDEISALLEQSKLSHSQQLAEMELKLQDRNQNYSGLLTALNAIDLVGEDNESDPVQKLRIVNNIILDERSRAATAELEANKSKQVAELLLAELNEVQERNDFLQVELVKVESSLAEYSTQKDDSLSRLEHYMSVHSSERARLAGKLMDFMSDIDQLKGSFCWLSKNLADVLSKDADLFRYMDDLKEFSFDVYFNPTTISEPVSMSSSILPPDAPKEQEIVLPVSKIAQFMMHQPLDETLLFEHFALVGQTLQQCISHCDELREYICKQSEFQGMKMMHLSETMDAVKRKILALIETSELLNRDTTHLELKVREKEAKISSLYENVSLLYEACSTLVLESMKWKSQITGNDPTFEEDIGNFGVVLKLPSCADLGKDEGVRSLNNCIKMMIKSIMSTVNDASSTNELVEKTKNDLKAKVLACQRELQEKDIQMTKVSEELVSQIQYAEGVAKRSMADLDSSRAQVSKLEKKAELLDADIKLLESKLKELQDKEDLAKLLQERVNSLADTVNAKDQEIEALMQALDEEETQMEALERNNKKLENLAQEKVMQLETLEASHTKTMSKLLTTVSKFDELHNLSENLLSEIEILQSQLQQRDSEISFLRQEVTRCTNDVLTLQGTNNKYSSDVCELVTWMNAIDSRIGGPTLQFDDQETTLIRSCIDITGKKIASAITELEELRATVQYKDALLETERSRFQEILSKSEDIKTEQSRAGRMYEQQNSSNSLGNSEIEQVVQRNKVTSGPVATHVRSGRKVNTDQYTIAIDTENDGVLVDEDDDKSHGFKSLTMSRLVPRAARPISDRIDGIWVSAQRLLMRQPTLRLAFLIYWIALHALLASFV